ncbi:MAG: hypothetical protein KC422_11720 [Trueperaceae bacterium]|nr:hypothetical protein [Trueperaceae bacterium]
MKLYVVHAIDTEGPLYESLDATFERLEKIIGMRLEPSRKTLEQIRNKELDLGGKEDAAALVVSPQLLNYNDSWDKVDAMLYEMLSPEYRQRYADPTGRGWVYTWFIVDHVGYDMNPRRRDMGYHNIFDHYKSLLKETNSADEINWHFHPMSTYKEAHICATSYLRSPHLLETLARRIIDRGWFPSCFRPGFHAERPDAHWFLEQWLPFDFANQATETDVAAQQDVMGGRLGDWRRAPNDWSPYHPAHDDYQTEGSCRRTIFRCLNVGTRFKLLDESEVERAFARAASGKPTILAFTNHDFRDMRHDVAETHALIQRVASRYPEVIWQNSGAKEAARAVLARKEGEPFELEVRLEHNRLSVTANHDSFGPQPFLAIKTHDKRYLTDNFDLQSPRRHWTYTFDADTVPLSSIESFGIASNDLNGSSHVLTFGAEGKIILNKQYHDTTW